MKPTHALFALSALALGAGVISHAREAEPMVNDAAIQSDAMPRTLAEYGFFLDPAARQPAASLIGYELNTPLYSDGADKLRYIYMPVGTQALSVGEDLLEFPLGTAIIKTFAYGEGDEQRFIETRVMLHRAEGWVALPYRWNEEQTEARLALAGGRVPITTPAGEEISYRIPNKNQCKTCHGKDGETVLIGPKGRNLSGVWLGMLQERGLIDRVDDGMDTMPHWEGRERLHSASVARAYLDVNCAHCHQPGGSASNSGLDLRWEQRDPHALGVKKPPVAAGRGSGGHKVSIAPGEPDASIMLHRMLSTEPGVAMPELGKETVDRDGVEVVRRWIAGMKR